MAKASDNKFPKIIITETSAPATPVSGDQKLFIDPVDHLLKLIDSSGTVRSLEPTASAKLDTIGSTRGSVLYRGASAWSALTPGTSTYVLTSNGAGADPSWQAPGGSGMPATVGTRVKRASGNVAINSSGYTAIGFDAEDYDTDAFHDTVTNNTRLTVPSGKGGKYHITASGYTDVAALSELRINGTTGIAVTPGPVAAVGGINVSTDYALAVGDYVELIVKAASGSGNVVYDADVSPLFMMHQIGT